MSYDELDASRDEMYDIISQELYPDHKQQAIEEFSSDRLRSYYVKNPHVMRPAIEAAHEAKALIAAGRHSPALVFSASAIELLLKATLLRPVVYGLVHNEALAEIIVQQVVGRQTDIDRYKVLLAGLFHNLAGIELMAIRRDGAKAPLLQEAKQYQTLRDKILHQGVHCSQKDSETAYSVTITIIIKVVSPMLSALGLKIIEQGSIERY